MRRRQIGAFFAVASLAASLLGGSFVAEACAHPASGIVVNSQGEVFFVHTGKGACKIDAQGKLTYIHQDTGGHWMALDADGRFSSAADTKLFQRITPTGAKPTLLFASGGAPLVVNRDGNLYFGSGYPEGDDMAPGGHTVTRLSPSGKQRLFAPELKATLEKLHEAVTGLAVGPDEGLYVACPNAILKVKMDGTVSTFLHPVAVNDCEDDLAKDSRTRFFHSPYLRGLDVTNEGIVFAAATGCRCVVKITPEGEVKTVLKSEKPWTPTGVAVRDKDVVVLEYSHPDKPQGWTPRVRRLGSDGKATILAVADPGENMRAHVPSAFDGAKAGDEREVTGMKLCWCPPGKFSMGSPASEPDRRPDEAQVNVTLSAGFWTGKHEVTQGQWKRVVGDFVQPQPVGQGEDFPVVWVNYGEAEEFCRKLTALTRASGGLPNDWEFRLPTEAQWEYACRAGTKTATSFGDKLGSKQANFDGGKPYNGAEAGPMLDRATPVGSYPANAWGLHDMHGNIYEWCRDWYHQTLPGGDDPDLSDRQGAVNRDGTYSRARRGGGWGDLGSTCRSAFRLRYEPPRRADHIGFRVVAVRP